MDNLRFYGAPLFQVAVVHGGPGAPGEMAPVATELSGICGILEPLLTVDTLNGQVIELKTVLEDEAALPVILVGFSFGAMLSFILAARYPTLVKKIILVGSGVFEDKYATGIMSVRLSRLPAVARARVLSLLETLGDPGNPNQNHAFAALGGYFAKTDAYDPLPQENGVVIPRYDVYERVWPQMAALRSSGELLALGKNIQCPVVAIHGDADPHPAEGIRAPLAATIKDFRFLQLAQCGHRPWLELRARSEFYKILAMELDSVNGT
jgi:pimeloyl-ACP methyl ester carboxylesterase